MKYQILRLKKFKNQLLAYIMFLGYFNTIMHILTRKIGRFKLTHGEVTDFDSVLKR